MGTVAPSVNPVIGRIEARAAGMVGQLAVTDDNVKRHTHTHTHSRLKAGWESTNSCGQSLARPARGFLGDGAQRQAGARAWADDWRQAGGVHVTAPFD